METREPIPHRIVPPTRCPAPGAEDLSPREREIIGLIANGHSNHEIATVLYLSPNTIKSHIRTGYRKIGVTRRTHAVLWWHHNEARSTAPDTFDEGTHWATVRQVLMDPSEAPRSDPTHAMIEAAN